MINLFNAQIESISIHKVGNKSRNESFFLSEEPYTLNDEITPLLKEFFLKPFRDKEENYYQFAHEVHMDYNEMFGHVKAIFDNQASAHEVSKKITKHLYDQHNHPHIKNGEVYVIHFKNITIDNNPVDAIGIFKSEIKSDFIQFEEKGHHLEMILQQGIGLNKLDKGALIFNFKEEEGYKILCVDQNRYDSRYWLEHFLSVDIFEDEHFHTKKYLKFVQDFGKEVLLPAEDKKAEVMFGNKALNYFAKNDEFEETNFMNEVIDNPDLIPEFKNFKAEKGLKYSIEDVSSFPISNHAVTDMRKKFKSLIKLDTGVEIKINITNPETADKVIERGFDAERNEYYYLIYGNETK